MADLEGLVRYRKHIVEEKQRFLAQLYREREQIDRQKQIIIEQIAKEKELAAQMQAENISSDAMSYLGRFMEGARRKIAALDQSLQKMDTRIMAAREDIRSAYAEQKKVEITARTRQERADAAEKRKEEQELDEIALEGYRRKLAGEEEGEGS